MDIYQVTHFCSGGEKNLDVLLGTGKSRQATGILSSTLQFSAQTTSYRTQLALVHKLIKKGRDTLGAPKGKKVILLLLLDNTTIIDKPQIEWIME